jgi:hypothetical protein
MQDAKAELGKALTQQFAPQPTVQTPQEKALQEKAEKALEDVLGPKADPKADPLQQAIQDMVDAQHEDPQTAPDQANTLGLTDSPQAAPVSAVGHMANDAAVMSALGIDKGQISQAVENLTSPFNQTAPLMTLEAITHDIQQQQQQQEHELETPEKGKEKAEDIDQAVQTALALAQTTPTLAFESPIAHSQEEQDAIDAVNAVANQTATPNAVPSVTMSDADKSLADAAVQGPTAAQQAAAVDNAVAQALGADTGTQGQIGSSVGTVGETGTTSGMAVGGGATSDAGYGVGSGGYGPDGGTASGNVGGMATGGGAASTGESGVSTGVGTSTGTAVGGGAASTGESGSTTGGPGPGDSGSTGDGTQGGSEGGVGAGSIGGSDGGSPGGIGSF